MKYVVSGQALWSMDLAELMRVGPADLKAVLSHGAVPGTQPPFVKCPETDGVCFMQSCVHAF